MKPDSIAWLVIAYCVAVSLTLCAVGHAETPTLTERVAIEAQSLGSKREPIVDTADFAAAVVEVAKGNRQWVALLTTIAVSESALAERIRLDQYSPHEGDSYIDRDGARKHLASGLWQVHANSTNAAEWGSSDLKAQARMASRLARGAFYMCRRARVPFPLGVFRALGSGSCTMALKGEEKRMRTYSSVLSRIQ